MTLTVSVIGGRSTRTDSAGIDRGSDCTGSYLGGTTAAGGGWLYALGGVDSDANGVCAFVDVGRMWSFGGPETWTQPWVLPAPRRHHTAAVHGDQLFVLGGGNGGYSTDVLVSTLRPDGTPVAFRPDGTLGSWYTGGALPDRRYGHAAVARDGTFYVPPRREAGLLVERAQASRGAHRPRHRRGRRPALRAGR